MRPQIAANAIDAVHVPNKKYGHFGHSDSSLLWIGITISVFSANVGGQTRRVAALSVPTGSPLHLFASANGSSEDPDTGSGSRM